MEEAPAAKVKRNYQYSGLDSVAGLFGATKRKYNRTAPYKAKKPKVFVQRRKYVRYFLHTKKARGERKFAAQQRRAARAQAKADKLNADLNAEIGAGPDMSNVTVRRRRRQ
jgi:hypothetical protein